MTTMYEILIRTYDHREYSAISVTLDGRMLIIVTRAGDTVTVPVVTVSLLHIFELLQSEGKMNTLAKMLIEKYGHTITPVDMPVGISQWG